jgi:cytochrome b561
MLLRIYWRCTNPNPVYSYHIFYWQKFAAIFLHRLIYIVVITQSLSGLFHLFFSEREFLFFNIFQLPELINSDPFLSGISKSIHYILSVVIYPLFAIHISAAIYHQLFGVRDDKS